MQKECIEKNSPLTVVLADLDGLKLINDTYGHGAGDHAIYVVAQTMKNVCPKDAVCVRIGGDEMMAVFIGAYNSEKLQKHVKFLYTKGNMYTVHNGNLLYHGCVPLNEDGTFKKVSVFGKEYAGKELYDVLEEYARKGYYAVDPEEKQKGLDILWFLWLNKNSPVYGKERMTTFESQFVADKNTYKEPKNPYYKLIEKEEVAGKLKYLSPDASISRDIRSMVCSR